LLIVLLSKQQIWNLTLIQAAMSKLRQEKQRIEGAFASKTGDGALVIASELTMRSRNTE